MPKLMVTGSERAQVHLALSSCDRQPQYLHDTLLSLFEDDGADVAATLRICVCGTSADYLGAVSESVSKNVQIDTVAEDVWERDYAPADLKRRVSRNFMRVLDGPPGPTIALQDDLSFASGWLSRAVDIADRISAQHGDDFVLALYASYRFKHKPFSPYDPLRFYGNQALWFSDRARRGLLESMRSQDRLGPDDMMLKDYLVQCAVRSGGPRTKLFAANPSLVQHIGVLSAIEDRFHQSPSFERR